MANNSLLKYSDWTEFKQRFLESTHKTFNSEKELCEFMGIDFLFYEKVINASINGWKISPSQSLFNAISKTKLRLPRKSTNVFHNIQEQTRFLMLLAEYHFLSYHHFSPIKVQGEVLKVSGVKALTISSSSLNYENSYKKFNCVLQCLYLYRYYCHKIIKNNQNIKIPKKLYRGIRLRDLYNHEEINILVNSIPDYANLDYNTKYKLRIDTIVQYIKDKGLKSLEKRELLSFTSLQSIAKYFTNNTGFIIEIEMQSTDMFTSEIQDKRFDQKDYVSNKYEKEFILSINNKMKISNIIINDLDYFIAANHPFASTLLDHDDKKVRYKMNGIGIEAQFFWKSNTSGSILFKNITDRSCVMSSVEFKKRYGFNPKITDKNLSEIEDFHILSTR